MPQTVIRQVQGEELLDITSQLNAYAFQPSPPLYPRENWERMLFLLDEALHFALFEDGRVVATVAANPLTQQIRGQIYRGGGIWGVATHPVARRRGYVKQLLQHLFAAMQEQGMAVSCLYPFRESFYDRLGYTTFPRARKVRFSPLALLPLLKKDLGGAVELGLIRANTEIYQSYLRTQQQHIHGMALFGDKAATLMFEQDNYWLATVRVKDEGEPVGMMLYQLKGEASDMLVPRFYYDDSRGLYLLLEWFARHADQVSAVEVKLPPYELPETWLADLNPEISSFEPPMGRVLNLVRLNGMTTGSGRFTAQISDPQCPWNNGGYLFETIDGQLQISPSATIDCELTIQALSALIYGTHDPTSFEIRGWGNPSPSLQTTLRTMFPPKLPYLHEVF